VGVNAFLQSDASAPVTTNFHVHVSEVRKFLEVVPPQAVARAPDPHELTRHAEAHKLDADGDGIEESTVYPEVVFSELGEGISIAVGYESGHTHVWLNDRLVIENVQGSGRGTAYRLLNSVPTKESDDAVLLDRAALPKAAAARFEAIDLRVLALHGFPVNLPIDQAPDPYAARAWKLRDFDGDSKPEAAIAGSAFVIDPKETLKAPITKAPIAVVRRGRNAWCLLGDRVLVSEDAQSGAVTYGPDASRPAAALMREGLSDAEQQRVSRALRVLMPAMATKGNIWPDPVRDVGTDVLAEETGISGLGNAAVSVVGEDRSSLMLELDRDAIASTPGEMERRAKTGKSAFDFAWIRRSETEWFLYDTDRDGTYDVALFLPPGRAAEGYRLVNGTVTRATELDGESRVRPSMFKDEKQRSALKQLAKVFFNLEVVEP
jgi:hypothetical protein